MFSSKDIQFILCDHEAEARPHLGIELHGPKLATEQDSNIDGCFLPEHPLFNYYLWNVDAPSRGQLCMELNTS